MPDGFVKIRRGEKRPIYGAEAALTGTLTISASPIPMATLFDTAGAILSGFNGVAVSGYDSGARSIVRVWLVLDTTSVAKGFYTLVFTFTATGSDGLQRVYRPSVLVEVTDVTS